MLYDIALSQIKQLDARRRQLLLKAFGSAENIFTAPADAFDELGVIKKYFASTGAKEEALRKAEKELKFIEQKNISVFLIDDENYPNRLRQCPDAPHLIYSTSNIDMNVGKFVSIVGTRRCTNYGRDLVQDLVSGLKEMLGDDLTIVSGLAHGIDVAAHRAALYCGVRTFGIVAHGLDTIYPAANRNVAAEMVKRGGAVITEYPTATQSIPANFLARNRIIAGLADVVAVVESAARGGALVTAGIANGYGRSVYAFPGRVGDKASEGCNMLLRTTQAGLIQCAKDLVKAEMWDYTAPKQQELFHNYSPEEQRVVDILSSGSVHLADIAIAMDMKSNSLSPLLIDMELKSIIEGVAGGRYRLITKTN